MALGTFIALVFASSIISAANDQDRLQQTGLPNQTFLNETWISWTLDWTYVGTSGLSCYTCLIFGFTPILMVQRLRGIRGQAGEHCDWSTHLIALTATGDERVLDRADTPTGFTIGDSKEKLILGLFWANLVLAVCVLVAHLLVSLGLEAWSLKRLRKQGVVMPPDGRSLPKKFWDTAAKWGLGRVITGVVCLPIYAMFRISCITIGARRELSSGTVIHAIAALAISLIILIIYFFVFPLLAMLRCTCERIDGGGDPDVPDDEIDEDESKFSPQGLLIESRLTAEDKAKLKKHEEREALPWLVKFVDDKVQWKFLREDDSLALICVAPVDALRSLKWWWWPLCEFCFTAAIDLAPLSAGSYPDKRRSTEQCFNHSMTLMFICIVFLACVLLARPFQKWLLLGGFVLAMLALIGSAMGAALREQTGAPMDQDQKDNAFMAPTYAAAYSVVAVQFAFILFPVFRKLCYWKIPTAGASNAGNSSNTDKTWDQELLEMLSVRQNAATRAGLAKKSKSKTGKFSAELQMLAKKAQKKEEGARLAKTSLSLPMLMEKNNDDDDTPMEDLAKPNNNILPSAAPNHDPLLDGDDDAQGPQHDEEVDVDDFFKQGGI